MESEGYPSGLDGIASRRTNSAIWGSVILNESDWIRRILSMIRSTRLRDDMLSLFGAILSPTMFMLCAYKNVAITTTCNLPREVLTLWAICARRADRSSEQALRFGQVRL